MSENDENFCQAIYTVILYQFINILYYMQYNFTIFGKDLHIIVSHETFY